MKKQDFIELYPKQDEESIAKVHKLLMDFCATTDKSEVKDILGVLDTMANVTDFMEKMEKEQMCTKPYTIQDTIRCLQLRLLRVFVDSLED